MAAQISKKRKFVADGVFRAELNEFFTRELAEEGYSGCDVRVTHARTEVAILMTQRLRDQSQGGISIRSSSAPPTPRKSSARRVVVSVNSLLSFKNDSNSPKTPSNYMLKKFNTVDSLPSLNVNLYATSSSVALLSDGTPI